MIFRACKRKRVADERILSAIRIDEIAVSLSVGGDAEDFQNVLPNTRVEMTIVTLEIRLTELH